MDFALSPHQERLWFIDQFERGQVYPHPPVYHNLPLILAGSGELPFDRAQAILQAMVARHEVLRTRLLESSVPARQTISESSAVSLETVTLPPDTSDEQVIEQLISLNAVPFVLDQQPLLRAHLVRIDGAGDAGRFWWLITLHHLIADRFSLSTLARELAATLRGEPLPAEPEFHYPDFVEWQRGLPDDALEPLLFYWKWQLRGRIPPLELPTAFPRAAIHIFNAGRHPFVWAQDTTRALHRLASAQSTTASIIALGLFKILLHRYARQDEVVIGTSLPNRRQPGTEQLIGPAANLVALRSHVEPGQSFADFLQKFSHTHTETEAHQAMPFDSLVRALNPAPDMSRTALFDVLATVDESPVEKLDGGPAGELHLLDLNLGHGKYDLALHLQLNGAATATGGLTFNTHLHQPEFIAQFIRHFETLVTVVAADPAARIDAPSLLSAAEASQQLNAFNPTTAKAPRDETLVSLFARQSAAHPDRIALRDGDQSVTYRELEIRANQLARHLVDSGIQTDDLVAVALARSPELIITLLAVLKSGGAYLPIDPTHPADRIQFTITDSGTRLLVSSSEIAAALHPPPAVAHTLLLDREAASLAARPGTPPAANPRPNDLAYCIYTSGSTGQPKGALIEHRQVVRLLYHDQSPFAFSADDVWTLFHSACFDFSVWEMYGALLYGGRLVLVSGDTARDAAAFADLVIAEDVTVLNQTPSAFREFDAALRRRGYPPLALREVIFGGETLAPLQLQAFAVAYPSIDLVNMYGITETTVHVTYHRLTAEDIAQNRPIIGRPLPTTTTLLLDPAGQLVPVGVPAEICVGGEGLARGYLNRPELTAEKFIPHPFAAGARLYRSGDVGSLQFDGTLRYLGRMDDQVQIRGFRVELGEIRTRLLQHPDITQAELITRPDAEGRLELIAYLVAGAELPAAALRQHVADTLPDYMIPATFIVLEAMPLTRNGKTDRAALPAPEASRTAAGRAYSAPATATETWVATTFATLLKARAPVGRDHHFFELGGHSLLAAQLVSRVREKYKVELPLKHIFASPTVAAFATVIDETNGPASLPPEPSTITRAVRRPVGSDSASLRQP